MDKVLGKDKQVTASVSLWNDDLSGASHQVQVAWTETCAGSGTLAVGSQTITAPPLGQAPAMPSASFAVTGACTDPGRLLVTATATVVGGTTGEFPIAADWLDISLSQIMGCPGSPDSAWAFDPQDMCADPVDTASGEFSDTFTDAALQGPGYPLAITRSYSSADTAARPLGRGWSLPWQSSLSVQAGGDVILTAENGDQYHYAASGGGTFTAPPGPRAVLAAVLSGATITSYTLTAPDNHVLAFSAAGQLQSIKDATGRGVTLGYAGTQVTSLTDAAGHQVTLSYSGALLTSIHLPDGHGIGYGYTGGRLTSATTPGGASGEITTYAYNAAGLLASAEDPDGNFRVRNTYDASGRVTSQEDGTGAVTAFSYTTAGGGLAETDVTDPDGGITTDLYAGGMLLEAIDPLGGITRYDYNQFLEPITLTDPLGRVITTAYDGSGNKISETDPLGNVQEWTYDARDNLTGYVNPGGHAYTDVYNSMDEPTSVTVPGGTAGQTTTYAYDASGNLTSMVDARGNTAGASAASFTTSYAYNPAGQLTSEANPDGDATAATYDSMGFPLTATDPLGHVTTLAYNSAEEVASVTAPDGGVTRYAYDLAGNIITRTDPDSHAWTYGYDADNRPDKVTDPLGKIVTYGYDGNSNQVTAAGARGIVTTTAYDPDNRPDGVTYSDGTPAVTYGYDADGNTTSVTDGTGTRTLAYDADGNLTRAAGPGTGAFTYAYDPDANITSRAYPDGTSLTYTYTGSGQVQSMTDVSAGSATTTYAYDPDQDLTSTAMPGGLTEARGYDNAGQLTSITDTHGTTVLDGTALTLNADGQPAKAVTTQNTAAQAPLLYTYNPAGQLTAACQTTATPPACTTAAGGNETTWSYDKAGNMLTKVFPGSSTTYAYNAAEQLTTATAGTTTTSYGYDPDGDLTAAGATTYAYNGAGELSKAVTSAGTFTYTYDAAGNLSADSKNGALQQTAVWDLSNPLPQAAEQTSAAGGTTADLIYNPNSTLNALTTAAGTFHATANSLGSITGLVSSAGTQVSSTTYAFYGTPTTTGTPASPIGYAGSYTLPGSGGLDDMHARDYNPANGTFTSADPLVAVTGQPYAYASDNPVANTDVTGACPSWLPGCGIVSNLVRAWWKEWYTNNPCNNPAAAALTPSQLASWLAEQYNGTVTTAKDGLKVLIPYKNRGIMVRVMEGKGGYYRVSIPGKQAYDVSGMATDDQAVTHIPISGSSEGDIAEIIAGIMGDL